ncbi:MAG: DUF4474 domain-containing protein [Faecalimonas umbilicata]|nr:DUF4474 domain-containing protein [Faecalimonas umbilicata]MDY5093503.1 DUF4474 domain-containing protein [Faecalimonas umbilicata]
MPSEKKSALLQNLLHPYDLSYLPLHDLFTYPEDAWLPKTCRRPADTAIRDVSHQDALLIYFDYNEKTCLIKLKKGQYGIYFGGEIGLYCADHIVSPQNRTTTRFLSIAESEFLPLSLELLEEDLSTFQLSKRHWRLSGFQIGRCPVSADSQLKVSVTFPDTFMLQRFIHGLLEAGYSECELTIRKLTISFLFPSVNESPNYHTRSSQFKENAVKWQNAFHCHLYSFLTHPFDNTTDKLIYLHTSHPSMFRYLCRIRS